MSAQHIPGPWALAWEDGKHGVVAKVLEGQIAQFVCLIGNVDSDPEKNGIRKANAQLIAAAPDLLAACEAALELMEADIADDDILGFGPDDEVVEVVQQLRDAISRAKGERDAVDG